MRRRIRDWYESLVGRFMLWVAKRGWPVHAQHGQLTFLLVEEERALAWAAMAVLARHRPAHRRVQRALRFAVFAPGDTELRRAVALGFLGLHCTGSAAEVALELHELALLESERRHGDRPSAARACQQASWRLAEALASDEPNRELQERLRWRVQIPRPESPPAP